MAPELHQPTSGLGVGGKQRSPLHIHPLVGVGDGCDVLHDVFASLCFSRSAFT